jgi:transposase
MQLRYNYRLYPAPAQRAALGREDSAGRYFASFVVEAKPGILPEAEPVVGLDLGLTWFAVLSDGRKITAPRFFYKARLYGRQFHRIGRFEPTSQTCSACGAKDGPKPLHVRSWQCQDWGIWLDRDINAAVNVAKAPGLAVTACGAQVRPGAMPQAPRSEAGTLPKSHRETA